MKWMGRFWIMEEKNVESTSFPHLFSFSFKEKNLFFEVHLMVSQSLSSIPVISSWPENRSSSLPYHELSPCFFLLCPIHYSVPFTFIMHWTLACTSMDTSGIHAQDMLHIGNYSNSLLSNSLYSVDAVGEFAKRRKLFKQLKESKGIYTKIKG